MWVGVLAFVFALGANFLWMCALVVATGDSTALGVSLTFSIGIVFSALAGVVFGLIASALVTRRRACAGWITASVFSPITMSLSNPAGGNTFSDVALLLTILGVAVVCGIWGALAGARAVKERNYWLPAIPILSSIAAVAIIVWAYVRFGD